MPNLKCHQYNCKSNHCTHCIKGTLSVNRDAKCEDYCQRTEENFDDIDFEFSYEQGMSLKQDDHRIICTDMECLNNASGECCASYIRIEKKENGAHCCQVREAK